MRPVSVLVMPNRIKEKNTQKQQNKKKSEKSVEAIKKRYFH